MGSCATKTSTTSIPAVEEPIRDEEDSELIRYKSSSISTDIERLISNASVSLLEKVSLLKSLSSVYLKRHSEPVTSLAYSHDFKTVISSSKDKTLKVWDLSTRKQINEIEFQGAVNQVIVSPDNSFLFVLIKNSIISQYRFANLTKLKDFVIEGYSIASISISPNNKNLFVGGGFIASQNTCPIHVFDVQTGKEKENYCGHRSAANCMVFTKDQKFMVSCSGGQYDAVTDNSVRLWKIGVEENIKIYNNFTDFVTCIVLGSSRKIVIAGCKDRSIHYLDFNLNKIEIFRRHDLGIKALALSEDELTLVSASQDSTIRLWDLTKKWQILQFSVASVNCLALLNNLIIAGTHSLIKSIDIESHEEIDFPGHAGDIDFLYIEPETKYLISGTSKKATSDSTLRVWNLSTGVQEKAINYLSGLTSLRVSKDGAGLIFYLDGNHKKIISIRGKVQKEVKHSDKFNFILMNRKRIKLR